MMIKWQNILLLVLHSNVIHFHRIQKYYTPGSLSEQNHRNGQSVWYLFKNLIKWLIHAWKMSLHSLIRNCRRNKTSYNNYWNCIYRRHEHFMSDIFITFQNTILLNPKEIVYPSLTHLYLDWFKINGPKHPLESHNTN